VQTKLRSIVVSWTIKYANYTMRAPNSTPTVSSSSSANRRCTLVAASARATSSSPLRPPIEGVRFSSRTRIRPAHPATVSSPPPSLSTELKTHQLFLPCLGDTAGESRNTLVNTRRGVTVVSRLRAPGGEAGRSECRSSFLPSDLAKERASGDASDPQGSRCFYAVPFSLVL
jgi:hypothetical protein